MFGKLGDRLNSSVINRNNFAPRIQKEDSHAPNQNSKFMCGVELETYGSNNVEAGIDTANGSPSMNIVLNLNVANTHSVKGTRVDSFAAFDALYQITSRFCFHQSPILPTNEPFKLIGFLFEPKPKYKQLLGICMDCL